MKGILKKVVVGLFFVVGVVALSATIFAEDEETITLENTTLTITGVGLSSGTDYGFDGSVLTILSDKEIKIGGSATDISIVSVASVTANITLDSLELTYTSDSTEGLVFKGNVNLTLNNFVKVIGSENNENCFFRAFGNVTIASLTNEETNLTLTNTTVSIEGYLKITGSAIIYHSTSNNGTALTADSLELVDNAYLDIRNTAGGSALSVTGDVCLSNCGTLLTYGEAYVSGDVELLDNSSFQVSTAYGISEGVNVLEVVGDVTIQNEASLKVDVSGDNLVAAKIGGTLSLDALATFSSYLQGDNGYALLYGALDIADGATYSVVGDGEDTYNAVPVEYQGIPTIKIIENGNEENYITLNVTVGEVPDSSWVFIYYTLSDTIYSSSDRSSIWNIEKDVVVDYYTELYVDSLEKNYYNVRFYYEEDVYDDVEGFDLVTFNSFDASCWNSEYLRDDYWISGWTYNGERIEIDTYLGVNGTSISVGAIWTNGEDSEYIEVPTDIGAPNLEVATTFDESSLEYFISITKVDGAEYSFDGENWSDNNTIIISEDNKEVTAYIRYIDSSEMNSQTVVTGTSIGEVTDNTQESVNTLSSLSVSGVSLSPSFSPTTTSYVATTSDVSTVTVSAAASSSAATVSGIGSKSVSAGFNVLEVTCMAEDGSTQVYSIYLYVEETKVVYEQVYKYVTTSTDDDNEEEEELEEGAVKILGEIFYLVDMEEENREGFVFGEVEVDGITLDGWTFEDASLSNYIVFDIENEDGEVVTYLYDKDANAMIPYADNMFVTQDVEEEVEEETVENAEETTSNDKTLTYAYTAIGVCSGIAVLEALYILKSRKKK